MAPSEKRRIIALAILLVTVQVVGFPRQLGPLYDVAQPVLQVLGIDVSLTPITSDMAAMVDRNGRVLYDNPIVLVPVVDGRLGDPVSFRDVPFHRVRVPMVTYLDHVVYQEDTPEIRVALCRAICESLHIPESTLDGFALWIPDNPQGGQEYGLNRIMLCRGNP